MAMAHSATISDVISWEPCGFDGEDDGENYTPARLRRLAEGRESVTIEDIAALDIPVEDRIWAGLHLLDEREQRLWGCDCAERALLRERDAGREPDPRSWEAVRVSRLYADGEATLEELDAAWSAWHAAWDADAAARAAADAAAWVAADGRQGRRPERRCRRLGRRRCRRARVATRASRRVRNLRVISQKRGG